MNIVSTITRRLLLWMGGGSNSERVLINLRWLVADRFIRAALGFIMAILVTRYLGPERFGLLSYAVSYVGVFMAFAGLGLETIVIREISRDVSRRDVLLGTAFILRSAAHGLSFLCIIASTMLITLDTTTRVLVVIIAFGVFFSGWDVIDYWFQSQVQSKFNVIAKNASFLLSIVIRLVLIVLQAPLVAFAAAVAFDMALNGVALIFAYGRTSNRIRKWRGDRHLAKELLGESWPLMVSALAISVYLRADQIILENFSGAYDVGIYAAAVKLSEIWYFIPLAISSSIFPIMVGYRKNDEQLFTKKFQKYASVLTTISIAIAVMMTVFSGPIVQVLYGARFAASASILSIYIWAGIFVFAGVAASNWVIIENRQSIVMYATVAGAVANVLLNIVLVPIYRGSGAAIATIGGYAIAGYLGFFLFRGTRTMAVILTKAIILPWRYLFPKS